MPELPEVETIRRCIAPQVVGETIAGVVVRNPDLRWPVAAEISRILPGQTVQAIQRRGKYLLLRCNSGTVLVHLGMSGRLLLCSRGETIRKHDHVDFIFGHDKILRLNDPRRFGCVLWTQDDPLRHPLLADLGPEPLQSIFSGAHLHRRSRGRSATTKQFIMDSRVVVGVGNIYASEALFAAGIHPARRAGRISLKRYGRLAQAIKLVLQRALAQGGTTLRDFCDAAGNPGYFQLQLMVYGRADQPCRICGSTVRRIRQGQRTTYFCSKCQR